MFAICGFGEKAPKAWGERKPKLRSEIFANMPRLDVEILVIRLFVKSLEPFAWSLSARFRVASLLHEGVLLRV
jgi:hypothetical protein